MPQPAKVGLTSYLVVVVRARGSPSQLFRTTDTALVTNFHRAGMAWPVVIVGQAAGQDQDAGVRCLSFVRGQRLGDEVVAVSGDEAAALLGREA